MEVAQLVVLLILGLLALAMAAWAWRSSRTLVDAKADAARLPDALGRAERAENQLTELAQSIKDSAVREATSKTQAEESRNVLQQTRQALLESNDFLLRAKSEEESAKRGATLLEAELHANRDRVVQLQGERESALDDVRRLNSALKQLGEQCAKAVAERDAAMSSLDETKAFLKEAQTHLRTAFTEAASKVFDEKTLILDRRIKDSAEISKKGFAETLRPFAEKVGEFQIKIEQLTTDQTKERATLVGTIGELKTLNQNMADATGALTKALKGNAKVRGDWGELILETVLKASGLEEGRDYDRQIQSSDVETGEKGRPDVTIKLPDGRRVVVDSKVNLIAWADSQNVETVEEHQDAMFRHATALRQHMRDLADKDYPKILGEDTLDMTVLFVPIEGALSAALAINPDLQTEAFSKKVVFASPNTLMAMLRVIERLWARDKLQRQINTIGSEAGKLMDALISFLEEFQAIEGRIKQVSDAYTSAKRRLDDSPQSVLARGRRLAEAAVKGRKAIPEELRPVAGNESIPLVEQDDRDE